MTHFSDVDTEMGGLGHLPCIEWAFFVTLKIVRHILRELETGGGDDKTRGGAASDSHPQGPSYPVWPAEGSMSICKC